MPVPDTVTLPVLSKGQIHHSRGLDPLHWYSRSKRTLSSNELQPIINNEDDLHLFVKKSDAEGNDFYYLGKVESHNQQDHTMPVGEGSALDVVTMDLSLLTPVEQGLYDYLTKKVSS